MPKFYNPNKRIRLSYRSPLCTCLSTWLLRQPSALGIEQDSEWWNNPECKTEHWLQPSCSNPSPKQINKTCHREIRTHSSGACAAQTSFCSKCQRLTPHFWQTDQTMERCYLWENGLFSNVPGEWSQFRPLPTSPHINNEPNMININQHLPRPYLPPGSSRAGVHFGH